MIIVVTMMKSINFIMIHEYNYYFDLEYSFEYDNDDKTMRFRNVL